jgi:hypothetical protein
MSLLLLLLLLLLRMRRLELVRERERERENEREREREKERETGRVLLSSAFSLLRLSSASSFNFLTLFCSLAWKKREKSFSFFSPRVREARPFPFRRRGKLKRSS